MSYFYARLGEEVRIKDHKLVDLVEAFLIKMILFYGGSSEKCKDGFNSELIRNDNNSSHNSGSYF